MGRRRQRGGLQARRISLGVCAYRVRRISESNGHPLNAGRDFSERDTTATESVIMINETLARTPFSRAKTRSGRLMKAGDDKDKRVVGVVSDVRHLALEQASGSEMYFPIRQTQDFASIDLVVRIENE